jgi:hypothetical protein
MRKVKIVIAMVFLLSLFSETAGIQVAKAAVYDRIWATSGTYTWTPGESRQIKVTGYLKDGSQVDLSSKASGTKYEIAYPNAFWADLPIVKISPDGYLTLFDKVADGVTASINIQNGSYSAQVGLQAKVPLKLNDIYNSYAKEAIIQLVKTRAISGFNDGTFRPHSIVLREQFTTMLLASGSNIIVQTPDIDTRPTYSDNQDTHTWYYPWVKRNTYVPALKPDSDITHAVFGIGLPISRQDAIYAIMQSYFNNETYQIMRGQDPKHVIDFKTFSNFGDLNQVKESYKEAVTVAKYLGITSGYADGSFHPDEPITREMAAQLINTAILKRITFYPNLRPFGY